MRIGLIGINHKSASLNLREKVARASGDLFAGMGVVALSTCNRTEVYFSGEDVAERHSEILNRMQQKIEGAFEHALYSYFGRECFLHLAVVTAGLDSALVGESDIQRQVKMAYQEAQSALPSPLHFLFQKCLKIGKAMRTEFAIYQKGSNLEGVVFELGRRFFLRPARVLFVGNSGINRKIIRLFVQRRFHDVALTTRNPRAAEAFALDSGIHLFDSSILSSWHTYDWVIAGAQSLQHLICPVQGEIRTKLAIDLGLPRNIDPKVGAHPQITLLNIEQVGDLVETRRRVLENDIAAIRCKIEGGVDKMVEIFSKKASACVLF